MREGQTLREADTGQYTLALDVLDRGGDLLVIDRREGPEPAAANGGEAADRSPKPTSIREALELEDTDRAAARAAYEACLAADAASSRGAAQPRPTAAPRRPARGGRTGLSRRRTRARPCCRSISRVLLEDFERDRRGRRGVPPRRLPSTRDSPMRISIWRACYERGGHPKEALRHLLAYRRLMSEP